MGPRGSGSVSARMSGRFRDGNRTRSGLGCGSERGSGRGFENMSRRFHEKVREEVWEKVREKVREKSGRGQNLVTLDLTTKCLICHQV